MRSRLAGLVRGHPVESSVGAAIVIGAMGLLVPRLDRLSLLVATAAMACTIGLLVVWFVQDHAVIEWTTSSGAPERRRGADRRITALSRAIDSAVAGEPAALAEVHSTLRSVARGRDDLGPELTAYLDAPIPPRVGATQLDSFVTTLEEH